MTYLKCGHCGWVHFGRTIQEIQIEMDRFNEWLYKQPRKIQKNYGGPSTLRQYMQCFRCGADFTKMILANDSEVPNGSTIQPILRE